LFQNEFPKFTNRRHAAQKISPLRQTLAIVLGSGFHHALKSPLQYGDC
jgi:hypothetical protein